MVFHWSLSDSKSPQVSRTLLSILSVLSNTVVWIVSILPLISSSPSPLSKNSVNVPRSPITIGITGTFMFLNFLSSWARSKYLTRFSLSFIFAKWSSRTAKSTIQQFSFSFFFFFLLITIRSGLLAGIIRWFVWVSESHLLIFSSMVKFQSFAQFPVDYCSYSVSRLVLLLYHLAALIYVNNRFFFFTS